jgi:hypothetical protein
MGRLFVIMMVCVGGLGLSEKIVRAESEEVKIEKVEVRFSPQGPVVLLEVGSRAIPIYVDPTVAGSIHGALTGRKFPRPLSHDLMHSIMKAYGVQVKEVFISLNDGIYYGTMTLSMNGETRKFDSRSSDAIALAIHFQRPIMVEQDLLDSEGKTLEEVEEKEQVLL